MNNFDNNSDNIVDNIVDNFDNIVDNFNNIVENFENNMKDEEFIKESLLEYLNSITELLQESDAIFCMNKSNKDSLFWIMNDSRKIINYCEELIINSNSEENHKIMETIHSYHIKIYENFNN